jgi:beta-galactosidase
VARLEGWDATLPRAGEAWLTLRFETAAAGPWAPAGFEVGWLQVQVAGGESTEPAPGDGALPLDDEGRLVHPLLGSAPALALWRAPTDNDRIGGMADRWAAWGLDRLEREIDSVDRGPGGATVRSHWVSAGGHRIEHSQVVRPLTGGGLAVDESVTIPAGLADLPRVGTVLELVPGLDRLEWFGTGPHETYPDRRRGGQVGRWRMSVDEAFVRYVRPQESGGRAGVRWLTLTDDRGRGLRLAFDRPLQVSATHFRAGDLASAGHDVELRPRAETIVHLDAAHRGLGTASCGPDTLPAYLVGPGTYRWSWWLQPLVGRRTR